MNQKNKYLRPPYEGVEADFSKAIKYYPSPDKKHSILTSHCWEYRMGANACLFHLVNEQNDIIEDFTPLTTNSRISWKKDSSKVAILVGEGKRGILIFYLNNGKFSFFKTNAFTFRFDEDNLVLFISDELITNLNSDKLMGGGITELPRVKYSKPDDILINPGELKLFNKENLADYYDIGEEDSFNIFPKEDGFWEFTGKLPENTIKGYNGRDFEIYQLEIFAKFGDAQSIEWLFEIKNMTNNQYSKWDKVSKYLGNREKNKNAYK